MPTVAATLSVKLRLSVDRLRIELTVHNGGNRPFAFSAALQNYFATSVAEGHAAGDRVPWSRSVPPDRLLIASRSPPDCLLVASDCLLIVFRSPPDPFWPLLAPSDPL